MWNNKMLSKLVSLLCRAKPKEHLLLRNLAKQDFLKSHWVMVKNLNNPFSFNLKNSLSDALGLPEIQWLWPKEVVGLLKEAKTLEEALQ